MSAEQDPQGDDLLRAAIDANPREERLNVRLTAREREKCKRAAGQMTLSDWARQVMLAAADGQPGERPTASAGQFRRQEALVLRLAERIIKLEGLILATLRAVHEYGAYLHLVAPGTHHEPAVMSARDRAVKAMQELLTAQAENKPSDDPIADVRASQARLEAMLGQYLERHTSPPAKRPGTSRFFGRKQ